MRIAVSPGLPRVVDVAASTGVPILAPRWPSSRRGVMCGVISAQQGCQNVHKTPGPVGHHVVMYHALQRPLEVLHHGTFDVIILTGEEVYVSGLEQSLEGCRMHFGALVTLHSQWRSGPPSQCRACWSKVVPRRTWKTRLCSRRDTWCRCWPFGTRCSPPGRTVAVTPGQTRWSAVWEAVAHRLVQRVTFLCCQGFSNGPTSRPPAWRLPPGYPPDRLGDSSVTSQAWWWGASCSYYYSWW